LQVPPLRQNESIGHGRAISGHSDDDDDDVEEDPNNHQMDYL
jgi:hypothetical protein